MSLLFIIIYSIEDLFKFNKGGRKMQTEIIKDLMKEYKRPFYIYDEKVIGDQIQELKTNFPEFEFLYSIKTNPNKDVIKFIAAATPSGDGEVI